MKLTVQRARAQLTNQRGKVGVILLALLLLGGGGFAVWYFVLRDAGGGGGGVIAKAHAATIETRLPAEAKVFGGFNVRSLLESDLWKHVEAFMPGDVRAEMAKLGLKLEDLDVVTFAASSPEVASGMEVVAVARGRFDGQALSAQIAAVKDVVKATLAGSEGFTAPGGMAVVFPTKGEAVLGSETWVTKTLERSKASAQAPPAPMGMLAEVADLRDFIDEDASFWVAGMPRQELALGMMMPNLDVRRLAASVDLRGGGVSARLALALADASQADGLIMQFNLAKSAFAHAPPSSLGAIGGHMDVGRKLMDGLDLSNDGRVLRLALDLDADLLKELIGAASSFGAFGFP